MAKPTVDGPGQAKLQQLESAKSIVQTVHGMVEQYALAIKNSSPTTSYPQQIKRAATPLVGLMRSQFQLLADLATAPGRSQDEVAGEVGQLKSGIELSVTSTIAKHSTANATPKPDSSAAGGE